MQKPAQQHSQPRNHPCKLTTTQPVTSIHTIESSPVQLSRTSSDKLQQRKPTTAQKPKKLTGAKSPSSTWRRRAAPGAQNRSGAAMPPRTPRSKHAKETTTEVRGQNRIIGPKLNYVNKTEGAGQNASEPPRHEQAPCITCSMYRSFILSTQLSSTYSVQVF